MSRSKKDGRRGGSHKRPARDLWGKRPLSGFGVSDSETKKQCRRVERRRHRSELVAEIRGGYPAWIRCPDCDDWWCSIHKCHVYDCECPAFEDWIMDGVDSYLTGGEPV